MFFFQSFVESLPLSLSFPLHVALSFLLLNGKSPSYCRKCCPVDLHSQTKKNLRLQSFHGSSCYIYQLCLLDLQPLLLPRLDQRCHWPLSQINKSMVSPLDESEVADMVMGGKQKIEDNTGIREVKKNGASEREVKRNGEGWFRVEHAAHDIAEA